MKIRIIFKSIIYATCIINMIGCSNNNKKNCDYSGNMKFQNENVEYPDHKVKNIVSIGDNVIKINNNISNIDKIDMILNISQKLQTDSFLIIVSESKNNCRSFEKKVESIAKAAGCDRGNICILK